MSADAGIGVVLSGGGANGAYEVGVLKALIEGASPATGYRPIDPGIYTGTSVGAYNAVIMASQPGSPPAAVVERLEALWLDRIANSLQQCGNGVYRVRGAPFQFLDPGCLVRPVQSLIAFGADLVDLSTFSVLKAAEFATSDASLQSRLLDLFDLDSLISESPLKDLIEQSVDLDGLRRSDKRLMIAASNWKLGILRLYSRLEIANRVGTAAILASTALPGIFPAVLIDDVPYVDGGVLLNTPLKPAIDAGASTVHVIFLDPLVKNIELPPLPSTIDTFYRLFAILWASNVRQDILTSEGITRTLEVLERETPETATTPERRSFLRAGRRIYQRAAAGAAYRRLTVHVYRPENDLGGGAGLLDFQRDRLAALVKMGYRDAVEHDCEALGCVCASAGALGQPVLAAAGGEMG